MILERVKEFLLTQPRARLTSDDTEVSIKCPFCGDSDKSDHGHCYIKLNVDENEPMYYHCFRASCGEKGVLTPDILETMGCTDPDTLMELAVHNSNFSGKKLQKQFVSRKKRSYELVNLNTKINQVKLQYVNNRLGTKLTTGELRDYKIQLSLYDFLRINDIRKLAFKESYCNILNAYCIGFVSMYSDYLILRDISKDEKTGKRYTIYRASGRPDPNDLRMYSIPREIDLLDSKPATINVAEGAFSILGAYLHTKIGRETPNSVWLANCGSDYYKTIVQVVKQYGLLDVYLNIWSDTEIPVKKYVDLMKRLEPRMNLMKMHVFYNVAAEDFGHSKRDIKLDVVTLRE